MVASSAQRRTGGEALSERDHLPKACAREGRQRELPYRGEPRGRTDPVGVPLDRSHGRGGVSMEVFSSLDRRDTETQGEWRYFGGVHGPSILGGTTRHGGGMPRGRRSTAAVGLSVF